ncbi:MAG: hypothetical protein U0992_04090 [Planctomycetaceae bacterium]
MTDRVIRRRALRRHFDAEFHIRECHSISVTGQRGSLDPTAFDEGTVATVEVADFQHHAARPENRVPIRYKAGREDDVHVRGASADGQPRHRNLNVIEVRAARDLAYDEPVDVRKAFGIKDAARHVGRSFWSWPTQPSDDRSKNSMLASSWLGIGNVVTLPTGFTIAIAATR